MMKGMIMPENGTGASPDDGFNSMPDIYNATLIGPGTAATGRDKALLNYVKIMQELFR